ncbi:MAG: O-antigen ligase family protein [Candidatus Omnitrophica bacterium]|nr:O-antigen ligase family protein [Candidatus Omnitrophota bacterium]
MMIRVALLLAGLRPFVNGMVSPAAEWLYAGALCGAMGMCLCRSRAPFIVRSSEYAVWALSAVLFFAAFGSVNPFAAGMQAGMWLVHACVFSFCIRLEGAQRQWALVCLLTAAGLLSVRAIREWALVMPALQKNASAFLEHQGYYYAVEVLRQRRATAGFSSPTLLAAYQLLLLPVFCAGLWTFRRQPRQMLLWAGLALCAGAALLCTQTVSALLCAAAGIAWFFFRYGRRRWGTAARWMLGGMMICCISALLFVAAARQRTFFDPANAQNSVSNRLSYWKSSIALWRERPWRGWGAGTFGIVYPRYRNEGATETVHAHNTLLQIGVENGWIGVGFFAAALFFALRGRGAGGDYLRAGLRAGSVLFALQSLVDFNFFVPQVSGVWWMTTALAAAEPPAAAGQARSSRRRWFAAALIAAIAALSLYFAFIHAQLQRGRSFYRQGNYAAARKCFESARAAAPEFDYPYYALALVERAQSADFSSAVLWSLRQASARNPYYAFYYYRAAQYCAEHRQWIPAFGYIEQARKLYPRNQAFAALAEQIHLSAADQDFFSILR